MLPKPIWTEGVDALVIDVFDVGTRVYTFVNHVLMIMKALAGKNIDIIILDRPNPLNSMDCEGNVIDEKHFSIVGQIPIPMRHSLTPGEFISYGLNYYAIDLQLEVVLVKNWQRDQWFKGIWTVPSPNMPSLNTAVVYPGAVMIEGTNLSEGRGTTRPFELLGAPFINNHQLVKELKGPFDFVFSDADKGWYIQYFKDVDPKLEPGGCFTAHNVLNGYGGTREFVDYVSDLDNYKTSIDQSSSSGISISYKDKK